MQYYNHTSQPSQIFPHLLELGSWHQVWGRKDFGGISTSHSKKWCGLTDRQPQSSYLVQIVPCVSYEQWDVLQNIAAKLVYDIVCATYCFQVDQKLDVNCIDTIQVKLLMEKIFII